MIISFLRPLVHKIFRSAPNSHVKPPFPTQFVPTNANNCRLHSITSEGIGNPELKAAIKCVHEYSLSLQTKCPLQDFPSTVQDTPFHSVPEKVECNISSKRGATKKATPRPCVRNSSWPFRDRTWDKTDSAMRRYGEGVRRKIF